MRSEDRVDLLFQTMLARFFAIPARQPASGAITFAQMRVLWVLEMRKSITPGQLAGALGISNPSATEIADRLVRGGYIRRSRPAQDRRQVLLALRPRGFRILGDFARRRRERFQRLSRVLAPRDMASMAAALETLNRLLGRWQEA